MYEFLPNVAATTAAIRSLDPSRLKILLGGSAIGHTDFTPHDLGVDAIVTDVAEAAQIARRIVGRTITKPSLEQQLADIGKTSASHAITGN